MSENWNVDDFLTEYRPPEQVVHITTRGDLFGRLASLEEELESAQQQDGASSSLTDEPTALRIAEEIQSVRAEVRDSMREFRVVAIGDSRWSDLVAKHPPGEDDRVFNPDTFWPEAVSVAVTSPQISVAQATKLLEVLSSGQTRKLLDAVMLANQGDDDLPKSSSGSVLRQHSKTKRSTFALAESLDPSSMGE